MATTNQSADRKDPWGNHYFSLEIDGKEVAHFLECSGLKSQAEVFVIEEGGMNYAVHTRPGHSKWGNLVLKYATSASTDLMEWRDQYITDAGFTSRANTTGAVVIRAEDGSELRRFSFTAVWPVSWEGPQLNSGGSDLAVETLEIAFDTVTIGALEAPAPPEPPAPETPEQFETEPVQFKYDSAELTPQGKETVGKVADELEKHPEVEHLWIEGHTCDLGSHGYNQSLSQARAESVKKELEKKQPGRVYHANGYSYDYPVRPNNSEGNRSTNRRTQFWTTPRAGKRSGELDYKSYK